MVTVLLRRNLADLLHSTGAKKPNETNKTVVLLQICVEKRDRVKAGRERGYMILHWVVMREIGIG